VETQPLAETPRRQERGVAFAERDDARSIAERQEGPPPEETSLRRGEQGIPLGRPEASQVDRYLEDGAAPFAALLGPRRFVCSAAARAEERLDLSHQSSFIALLALIVIPVLRFNYLSLSWLARCRSKKRA
jgi:hypothetical protein